jgi:uncharacterized membrane protein
LFIFFGLIYSFYSVIRHLRFETFIFDLGIYDQMIWLASRGKPLFSTVLQTHFFGDHFTPTLILLAPLYWVWNNVLIILIFQAFFCAFGVFPIYFLALKKTKDQWLSLVISFCYIAFFGAQNAIAFDFHPIVLATTLFAWVLWFYEEKKWKLFWVSIILILGLQENFSAFLSAYGLFLIFQFRDFKKGVFLFLGCGFLFFLLISVIIPYFNAGQFIYAPSHLQNLSLWEMVKMFVYPFSKIQVMFVSLLCFAFLPVLTPAVLIILFEEFLQRFVGTPIATRWNLGFQYNIILAPVLALGAVLSIEKYLIKQKRLIVILLLFCFGLIQITTSPALSDLVNKNFYNLDKNKNSRGLLSLIPANASVAAANNLGPQLAHREKITFLTNCLDDPRDWKLDMRRCFNFKPDYLIVDLDPKGDWNNYYPDGREALIQYVEKVQVLKEYFLVKKEGEAVLLKRND